MTRNPPQLSTEIEPMRVGDMAALRPQDHQISVGELVGADYDRWLLAGGPAYTARRLDGQVMACFGVVEQWDGRGMAWAVLDREAGKHLLSITRKARGWFDAMAYRRVEAYIDTKFPQGRRWVHLLGFTLETDIPMRKFFANGNDAYLYARVS